MYIPGSHHNHYGSTTSKKVLEVNGTKTTTLTLRTNQLARLEEPAEFEEDLAEDEPCSNIYHEASTLSATTTSSRTKNRKVRRFEYYSTY
jgi:hypothetical protein